MYINSLPLPSLPFSFLCMYYLAVSEIKVLISHCLFCVANPTVRLRVCFVNFSSSFYRLILTFAYDFPSTHHPHTHNISPDTNWLRNVLVSGEKPLLLRRILKTRIKTATKVTDDVFCCFVYYYSSLQIIFVYRQIICQYEVIKFQREWSIDTMWHLDTCFIVLI